MNEKRQREWEQLERSLEEMDKIAQECMAKGLCGWCCERPAVTTEGECKECSRLPGHTHAGEDERDDTITRLQRKLREAQAGAAVLRDALDYYTDIMVVESWNYQIEQDAGGVARAALESTTAGAELLRELDDLRDQKAKLESAAEVAEVNLDIVLETESWFWENDRGGGLKGLLIEARGALKGVDDGNT